MKPYSAHWAPLALIWLVLPKIQSTHPVFGPFFSISQSPGIQAAWCMMRWQEKTMLIAFSFARRRGLPSARRGRLRVGEGGGAGGEGRQRQKGTVALYGIVAGCWWQAHAASRLLQWSGGIWVISSLFTCNYSPLLLLSPRPGRCATQLHANDDAKEMYDLVLIKRERAGEAPYLCGV